MVEVGEHRRARVRVLTWNVQGAKRPDPAVLARVVADADPDVVALQEVRRGQASALAGLLGIDHHRWIAKHRPFGLLGNRWAEGLAVLSRFPVLADAGSALSEAEPMRSFRRRVLQEVVVGIADGVVRIANTHLSSDDDDARAAQTERAVALLAEVRDGAALDRTVLVGDLNTEDAPAVVGRLLGAGFVDAWTLAGVGPGHTNPAHAPVHRLDHVLAGTGFEIEAVRVVSTEVTARVSDHLPVVADLVVR